MRYGQRSANHRSYRVGQNSTVSQTTARQLLHPYVMSWSVALSRIGDPRDYTDASIWMRLLPQYAGGACDPAARTMESLGD